MAKYPKEISIEKPNFCLRKPGAEFSVARDVFLAVDRNRDFFRPWLGWVDFVKSPEDEFSVVQSVAKEDVCKYFIYWYMRLVGMVGVVREDKSNRTMEIGYWLSQDVNGNGVMSQAVRQVQDLCFKHGEANRVEIRCATNNLSSCRIPERLGYTHEGILRSAEVLHPGVVHDIAVYSKLKSEWEKGK